MYTLDKHIAQETWNRESMDACPIWFSSLWIRLSGKQGDSQHGAQRQKNDFVTKHNHLCPTRNSPLEFIIVQDRLRGAIYCNESHMTSICTNNAAFDLSLIMCTLICIIPFVTDGKEEWTPLHPYTMKI
jgi:hypothetical protein